MAAATAHNRENPNSAPAWTDVEIEPTSTNPPMLVTMPERKIEELLHGRSVADCLRFVPELLAVSPRIGAERVRER